MGQGGRQPPDGGPACKWGAQSRPRLERGLLASRAEGQHMSVVLAPLARGHMLHVLQQPQDIDTTQGSGGGEDACGSRACVVLGSTGRLRVWRSREERARTARGRVNGCLLGCCHGPRDTPSPGFPFPATLTFL